MTEVFSPEELEIMNSSLNLPAKADALEKIRIEKAKRSPGPPAWNTNATANSLRAEPLEMRRLGDSILAFDAETEEHTKKLDAARERIRQLESPNSEPTDDMAAEFSRLKAYEILMTNFLSGVTARRAVLVNQIWARVEGLKKRLFELTGRAHWTFGDRNIHRPENVHVGAAQEIERILAGRPDAFDLMNEPGPNFSPRTPQQVYIG